MSPPPAAVATTSYQVPPLGADKLGTSSVIVHEVNPVSPIHKTPPTTTQSTNQDQSADTQRTELIATEAASTTVSAIPSDVNPKPTSKLRAVHNIGDILDGQWEAARVQQ
jgi:hypothetical protein